MNKINTYDINNNQNTDLTDVQWIDKDDSLFRSFYDLNDSDEEKELALKDHNRVKNRVSINQNARNETSTALRVEKMIVEIVIEEIEHEDDLYENFEKDMQNTSVLSSNEHDFSSASEISSRRFSRIKKISNLSFETVKYDSKKTPSKQITDSKSHQYIIRILAMLNLIKMWSNLINLKTWKKSWSHFIDLNDKKQWKLKIILFWKIKSES